MKKLIAVAALVLAAVSAAGCGRMADLEAPQRQTERAQRSADGPDLPDPAETYRPSSIQPIDGGPSNPYGGSGSVPGAR